MQVIGKVREFEVWRTTDKEKPEWIQNAIDNGMLVENEDGTWSIYEKVEQAVANAGDYLLNQGNLIAIDASSFQSRFMDVNELETTSSKNLLKAIKL